MSIVEYSTLRGADVQFPVNADSSENSDNDPCDGPYHRLGAVRRLQGVSRRSIARRLQVDVSVVRRHEDEHCDLPLSMLYQWQQILEVPMSELFAESEDSLSKPLLRRAQLVRLMKTALALSEQPDAENIRPLAEAIVEVLVKVMPELDGISAWHVVGKRRRLDELGVAAMRTLSEDMFTEPEE